jgi:hypothetical protein
MINESINSFFSALKIKQRIVKYKNVVSHSPAPTIRPMGLTLWSRSSSKQYLSIQHVPQRKHNTLA